MESLDINSGAAALADILEPPQEQESANPEDELVLDPELVEEPDAEPEEAEEAQDDPKIFTIIVDGKEVEVSESELADAYKNGLRQSDYTKKTMEVAEQRKAAEAEIQRAQSERAYYAQQLQDQTVILQAALAEQNQTDWQQLITDDPVEYLKQQNLLQQRQSALNQMYQQQQMLAYQQQQEQAAYAQHYLAEQQQELLAKLPEWKDESKAKADRSAIRDYLRTNGFEDSEIGNVSDHRAVVVARKAMLYDRMVAKAQAAAKQVKNVPQRVERPATGSTPNLDKRTANYQRLAKSGRVEDAAAVFANLI